MNPFAKALCLFAACVVISNTSSADTLTVKEAVDTAIKNNPTLLAARRDVDAAAANERGARALSNPEIVVTPGVAGDAGSDEELSVSQPLEVNGRRKARTRIAEAEREASQAALLFAERDIARLVKQAYWELVQAGHIVKLNKENVALAEALNKAAERQRDVGSAPGAQVLKTQVELSRARQELLSAESDLDQAKASLNTLLGRLPGTPLEPSDTLTFTSISVDAAAARSVAESNRPEIGEAQALLTARRAEIDAVDAEKRPDLAIQARQETLGGAGGVAMGISIPILDWGALREEKKRSRAAADAQSKRIEAVRNAVLLDVDSALRDVARTEKLIREYDQGVLSQAERLADMAQKGYKAGAIGYLEVLEAQRTLRGVRTEYYTALAGHSKALAQLEWAVSADLSSVISKEASK